jgi:hypothetical protein
LRVGGLTSLGGGVASVEERVGSNEAIFRHVNERITEMADDLAVTTLQIVCECADVGCAEAIEIRSGQYRRAREDDAVFILVPEHVLSAVEDVVYEGSGFVFVRKRGEAAEAAEEAAP